VGVGQSIDFYKMEARGAIFLFIAALAALILCNSPWAAAYQHILEISIAIDIDQYSLSQPLLFWVNEGLMSLFFLSVGLELKQEFCGEERTDWGRFTLPLAAALGGMLIPVLFYVSLNMANGERLAGWAIPVATDIAFAVGVLSLFGKRVPLGLRMFLLALAIFDDVGAIIIIAFFHPQGLSAWSFLLALLAISGLCAMNYWRVQRLSFYLLAGLVLWLCVLQSGVHATIAGVVLGLLVPFDKQAGVQVTGLRLQRFLQPWVTWLIMPLFAFTNAGVDLRGLSLEVIFDSVTLGIIFGLCCGKPLGVMLFSWLILQTGRIKLPANTTWFQMFGVAALCGIGFTMSLFLGTLAFQGKNPHFMAEVKLGVLVGSLISGIIGALILRKAFVKKVVSEERQV
jgi:NhaA family Na+:H+ antiporter